MLKFKHFCVKSQIVTEMSYFRHILTSREVSVNSELFTQNLQYLKGILTNTNLTQSLHNLNTRQQPSVLPTGRTAACATRPGAYIRAWEAAASWKLRRAAPSRARSSCDFLDVAHPKRSRLSSLFIKFWM